MGLPPARLDRLIHAFTSGQYEKTNQTDCLWRPAAVLDAIGMSWAGLWKVQFALCRARARAFLFFRRCIVAKDLLFGLTAISLLRASWLLILLNPPPDRAEQELVPRDSLRLRTRRGADVIRPDAYCG